LFFLFFSFLGTQDKTSIAYIRKDGEKGDRSFTVDDQLFRGRYREMAESTIVEIAKFILSNQIDAGKSN
jgi:hypothetical protein